MKGSLKVMPIFFFVSIPFCCYIQCSVPYSCIFTPVQAQVYNLLKLMLHEGVIVLLCNAGNTLVRAGSCIKDGIPEKGKEVWLRIIPRPPYIYNFCKTNPLDCSCIGVFRQLLNLLLKTLSELRLEHLNQTLRGKACPDIYS